MTVSASPGDRCPRCGGDLPPDAPGDVCPTCAFDEILPGEVTEEHLNPLFETYRRPLLVWLRARQYSQDDADDIVQDFFISFLRHDFLKKYSPEQGSFRAFLLTSLKNYLSDRRDRENPLKRGGGQVPDSLQETDDQGQPLPGGH